ncbi:STAS domain-containing protein [Saccharopolyspora mangrovi]|uniref:STAS domain-containing protein n=1 Tax=Saccharopolyspora mangrovi TaxID=3082379 RepID=A0ABU6AAT4_9PSEU|nr:STAS domain-containing protein [Saccharopolyspora sp. S2-29]MEB3368621.1 STAS domain-containing protein [Saccharopolyspora sp. S2-29]
MTAQAPDRVLARADAPPEAPSPRGSEIDTALRLRLRYPGAGVVVLVATGEIDVATAPRMAALLWPRLLTGLHKIVLDLTGITFLGVAGLELISAARAYAPHRNAEVIVLSSTAAVARALRAGGLADAAVSALQTGEGRQRRRRARTRRGLSAPVNRPATLVPC